MTQKDIKDLLWDLTKDFVDHVLYPNYYTEEYYQLEFGDDNLIDSTGYEIDGWSLEKTIKPMYTLFIDYRSKLIDKLIEKKCSKNPELDKKELYKYLINEWDYCLYNMYSDKQKKLDEDNYYEGYYDCLYDGIND